MQQATSTELSVYRGVVIDPFTHAACATRIVGILDDAIAVGVLADRVEGIVHASAFVGDVSVRAAPGTTVQHDRVAPDDAPLLASASGGDR